jgi:hypothetical protein
MNRSVTIASYGLPWEKNMKFALILTLMTCSVFAAAADNKIAFSTKLAWEATKDKILEFPHPEAFAVTVGMAGFEDALLFRGANNASISIALIDERAAKKSLPKAVAGFEEAMHAPGSKCSKGQPGQGKLANGWAAAWTHSSCANKDGTSTATSLVVFRAADRLYLLSGVKVPSTWALDMAGKGRLKK